MYAVGTLIQEDGNRSIRAGVRNMLRHLLHDERIPDDETNDSRSVAVGALAENHPLIELDKQHQPDSAQNRLDCGFEVGGGFRLLRRLHELSHIWVSDRSLDRRNNRIERPCGNDGESFHFHFSYHSDSLPSSVPRTVGHSFSNSTSF